MTRGEIACLADCATTHTVLKHRQLFVDLTPCKTSVITMIGSKPVIEGRGHARFLLPNGTLINVKDALFAPRGARTLLSFKDIRANNLHLNTFEEKGKEYLLITGMVNGRSRILEKLEALRSGLYPTTIRIIESYAITNHEIWDTELYKLWHDRLGHPGRDMMIRILKNSYGHPFFRSKKRLGMSNSPPLEAIAVGSSPTMGTAPRPPIGGTAQVPSNPSTAPSANAQSSFPQGELMHQSHALVARSNAHHSFCKACTLAKLDSRPSFAKDSKVLLPFLHRIQGDICGPIQPECGPFKYFMVLVDASTRWSHVSLLSTRNAAFAKLLAQIIRLRAHYPDYPIKSIRLDNAGEFTSKTFDDYCMSLGIDVEHPVPHVHSQNGLAEAAIKRLQVIARALVMRTHLPVSAWGYAILHAATLIRFRPTADQPFSAYQLVTGFAPDIAHLRIFGCAVYVPLTPPLRNKLGPQRRLGIYVGYDSPTIIRYLEPSTGDLFTARFADCHFEETSFPLLGGDKNLVPSEQQELAWSVPTLSRYDPRTPLCDREVRRILELQNVADSLPDAFNDTARVTRSHIPAANTPARLELPRRVYKASTMAGQDAAANDGAAGDAAVDAAARSAKGEIGNAVLAGNVDGVGNETVKGFSDHWEIGGVLEELESGGIHMESVLEEEVDGQPWEAPEALDPVSQSQHLPDRRHFIIHISLSLPSSSPLYK